MDRRCTLLIAACLLGCPSVGDDDDATEAVEPKFGPEFIGGSRPAYVIAPADYDGITPTPVVFLLALGGSFVSYIYSAPPLKLKQNGWLGNYALGASYIALPWWAGQALFGQLTWTTAILTLAYSLAGLGIAVVNDFKSVEGDRALGLQSLPVVFGIRTASWISAGMIDVFQLAMVAVLIAIGLLVLLIVPQITFQDIWLLRDPVAFDVKYQASAQPFLVLGMLVTAIAVGHSPLIQGM